MLKLFSLFLISPVMWGETPVALKTADGLHVSFYLEDGWVRHDLTIPPSAPLDKESRARIMSHFLGRWSKGGTTLSVSTDVLSGECKSAHEALERKDRTVRLSRNITLRTFSVTNPSPHTTDVRMELIAPPRKEAQYRFERCICRGSTLIVLTSTVVTSAPSEDARGSLERSLRRTLETFRVD